MTGHPIPRRNSPCTTTRQLAGRPTPRLGTFAKAHWWRLWQRRSSGPQGNDRVAANEHAEAGVVPSMGSAGDCYDNALCESFFATLKCELIERSTFRTRAEARVAVFDFAEAFYNRKRRHSSLGYISPGAFERAHDQDVARHHSAAARSGLSSDRARPDRLWPVGTSARCERSQPGQPRGQSRLPDRPAPTPSDWRTSPWRRPDCSMWTAGVYQLVFIGRSGRPFPAAVEVAALVPGLEPMDTDQTDEALWSVLSMLRRSPR